jgi:predicted heme/steroid binding protein
MKRFFTIGISILALALFAVGCASGAASVAPAESAAVTDSAMSDAAADTAVTDSASDDMATEGMLELTLDQLKQYDGKNGNPAYVAVDGVIYDVSGSARWKNGEHNGYSAGNDLTDAIMNKSPHGVKNMERMPVVGKLVDG